MKKFLITLIAATVLGAPLAQAQGYDRYDRHQPGPPRYETDYRRPVMRPVKKFWSRGERLPGFVDRRELRPREVMRFGLPIPRRGETWVQVGRQLLLVRYNSGLIVMAR